MTRSLRFPQLVSIALVLLAVAPPQALAQDSYPSRPIRIVVPIPTGSGTDTVARLIAKGLSERLGRQVFVENRPGAGTFIGNEIVAKAKPDGYSLLMNGAAFTISPAIYRKIPYDAWHDFAPITVAVFTPNLLVVHPSVPVKSVKEFIALAKAQPGKILYASGGNGTNSHLAMALFASMAQIRVTHVPYKGSIPGIIDLLAGNVAMAINSMSTVMHHVRAGKLRALGVASMRRVAAAPELPTIAEAGVPGYESVQWSGLLAPAGTPQEIIARLHRETVAIVSAPDMKKSLAGDGSEVIANSPDEFAAFIKLELAKWAKVVKATGIEPM
jgi:tripartite-type tricarboxylate transporter receptor subunit TctC